MYINNLKEQGINYYTSVGDQSQFIVKDIRVLFLKNDITIFDKIL